MYFCHPVCVHLFWAAQVRRMREFFMCRCAHDVIRMSASHRTMGVFKIYMETLVKHKCVSRKL